MLDIYCRGKNVIYILQDNVIRYNCWTPGSTEFIKYGLEFVDEVARKVPTNPGRVQVVLACPKIGTIDSIDEFNEWLTKYYFAELL